MTAKKQTGVAKQHAATKEAQAKFVPSTGDEDYLQTREERDAKRGISLGHDAKEINALYASGLSLAQRATKTMIEVGSLLLIARENFKGDKEFGVWRKKAIEFSQSHAQRLMAVAREFGDNPDAQLLPVGTLAELLPASPALKKEVIEEAKEGKKPTRAEVTERKKAEQAKPSEGDKKESFKEAADKFNKRASAVKVYEPFEIAQMMLDKPFIERLREMEVRGTDNSQIDAFIIFGIPPYHEGLPSIDLIHILYHGHFNDNPKIKEDGDLEDKFTAAYDILVAMY